MACAAMPSALHCNRQEKITLKAWHIAEPVEYEFVSVDIKVYGGLYCWLRSPQQTQVKVSQALHSIADGVSEVHLVSLW